MFLQDRHAGDVCQRLGQQLIGVIEFTDTGAEQTQGTQNRPCCAHRHRVHRGETGVGGGGDEPRPTPRSVCTSDTEMGCPLA
jgi:hypothetical protein